MGWWNWLFGSENSVRDQADSSETSAHDVAGLSEEMRCPSVNPATGLPMMGCAMDVEGNPYGTDLHHDDPFDSLGSGLGDDPFDTMGSGLGDDPFSDSFGIGDDFSTGLDDW